jgi:hypothetical protein
VYTKKIKNKWLIVTADNSPSRSLVVTDASTWPVALGPDLQDAAGYARAEKAEATKRAYRSDFALFRAWCETKHVTALPAAPKSVAAFLAAEARKGRYYWSAARRHSLRAQARWSRAAN